MKRLKDAFDEGHVVLDLDASDMEPATSSAVRRAVAEGMLPEQAADQVEPRLLDREQEARTAIGRAVAIPHAYLDILPEPLIVLVRLAQSQRIASSFFSAVYYPACFRAAAD